MNNASSVSHAKLKNAPISPQKMRLLVDMVRGRRVMYAIDVLSQSEKKASLMLMKLIHSAVANAEHQSAMGRLNIDIDDLYISKACVDQAPTLRRMHARAKGRGSRILRRRSHILIELDVFSNRNIS